MNRLLAALAAVMSVTGLNAVATPTAVADTITVTDPSWSVSLTFPDLQWSSEACQFLPVTAVVAGPQVASWTFGGFVLAPSDDEDRISWYIDYDQKKSTGSGNFNFRHAVELCPGPDYSGEYEVVGEVGVLLTGATDWFWLPYRAAFTVTGVPTTTTLDAITIDGPEARFVGRLAASPTAPTTFRGCSGGEILIEVLGADSEWNSVAGSEPAADGSYVVTVPTRAMVGEQYRAWFSGGRVCAPSKSEQRNLQLRVPKVKISSVANGSRLKVDIDPNKGAKAWVFQVQREGEDAWQTLRTYRTVGKRETRTINLPQGTYRVLVSARFGYAATYSDSVYLQR